MAVAAGRFHTLALRPDGSAVAFGSYDEDGNELPELEVEDPYKNDYQQVKESLPSLPIYP